MGAGLYVTICFLVFRTVFPFLFEHTDFRLTICHREFGFEVVVGALDFAPPTFARGAGHGRPLRMSPTPGGLAAVGH